MESRLDTQKYQEAVFFCDEAILLGYNAPLEYLNALAPYRTDYKSDKEIVK